jgi:hypothetical protein
MLLFDGSLFETAEWCVPGDGDVIGVLQIINKADGPFSLMDEEVCGLLTSHSGVCLRNAKRHATQAAAHRKFKHVADLVKAMQGGNGGAVGSVNSLIFTIQAKAPAIVDADRYGYCITARARSSGQTLTRQSLRALQRPSPLSLSLSLSLFRGGTRRCTVFLLDEKSRAIWSQQGEVNVRIDLDKPGIATSVHGSNVRTAS